MVVYIQIFTDFVTNILDSVTNLIYSLGHVGIFTAALIETVFPIIPSELIFPLAGYVAQSQNLGIWHAITFGLSGAIGSTVGALIIYFLALKVGRKVILKIGRYALINESKLEKAELWFARHGKLAVLLGRLAPGVRELISIPAGLAKMKITEFIIFTFIGSCIWSLILTLIGFYLGEAWDNFSQETSQVFNIIAIIIFIAIIAFLVFKYYKNKTKTKKA